MRKHVALVRAGRAATAIEYGLIAALIAVAAITATTALGSQLSISFGSVGPDVKAG